MFNVAYIWDELYNSDEFEVNELPRKKFKEILKGTLDKLNEDVRKENMAVKTIANFMLRKL